MVSLKSALDACLANDEFMSNYRRLTGHSLGLDSRSALDRMIDKAMGHEPPMIVEAEAREFFEFVRDYVWRPVACAQATEDPRLRTEPR